MIRHTPISTLFPYTTLFRSLRLDDPDPAHEEDLVDEADLDLADDEHDVSSAADLDADVQDRKSTRLNSSHITISYAVFCLKKKNKNPRKNAVLLQHDTYCLC